MASPSATRRPIRGVVFDCDGLLLDSESRWTIAETAVVERHGGTWSAGLKARMVGTSLEQTCRILSAELGLPRDAEPALGEEIMVTYAAVLGEHGAEPMAGVPELVDGLRRRGLPLAVASNTPTRLTAAALAGSGLPVDAFSALVCAGDDGLAAKPAPDVYIAACRAIGREPAHCLAFEDSPTGAAAARAAGLRIVGVPSVPGQALDADVVLETLAGADVDALLGGRG